MSAFGDDEGPNLCVVFSSVVSYQLLEPPHKSSWFVLCVSSSSVLGSVKFVSAVDAYEGAGLGVLDLYGGVAGVVGWFVGAVGGFGGAGGLGGAGRAGGCGALE